jgi:hypothetical protein
MTFWFVAQCLNHCATACPKHNRININEYETVEYIRYMYYNNTQYTQLTVLTQLVSRWQHVLAYYQAITRPFIDLVDQVCTICWRKWEPISLRVHS